MNTFKIGIGAVVLSLGLSAWSFATTQTVTITNNCDQAMEFTIYSDTYDCRLLYSKTSGGKLTVPANGVGTHTVSTSNVKFSNCNIRVSNDDGNVEFMTKDTSTTAIDVTFATKNNQCIVIKGNPDNYQLNF